MTTTTDEQKVLRGLKEAIRGVITYKDIADPLNIAVSTVSNVFNGYSPYNQIIVDKAIELKNIALAGKAKHVQDTAKRLSIKI